jgi:hypothetical protein
MKELEVEIKTFEKELSMFDYTNNLSKTKKNYIYLRLSKLDSSLPKIDRIKDTMSKLRADYNKLIEKYPNLEIEGFKSFIEVKSAYKNSTRDKFIDLYNNYLFNDIRSVKDILENKEVKINKFLYISSFDRLSRVFFYSLTFQLLRKLRGIKILTLMNEEVKFENENENIDVDDNLKQTMFIFQLMLFSSSASKHSEDMSNKIKRRVNKTKKGTFSNKTGNKWGVGKQISLKMERRICYKMERFTAKEVSEQSDIYKRVEGKKEKISIHTINKISQKNK